MYRGDRLCVCCFAPPAVFAINELELRNRNFSYTTHGELTNIRMRYFESWLYLPKVR